MAEEEQDDEDGETKDEAERVRGTGRDCVCGESNPNGDVKEEEDEANEGASVVEELVEPEGALRKIAGGERRAEERRAEARALMGRGGKVKPTEGREECAVRLEQAGAVCAVVVEADGVKEGVVGVEHLP